MRRKLAYALAVTALLGITLLAQTAKDTQSAQDQRSQRAVYTGEWKVGTGVGNTTFFITLATDGSATKSIGSERGTWEVVGAEARIAWSDGWHDVIRKAGNHYEKAAYAPGRAYSESPSNITGATRTEPL